MLVSFCSCNRDLRRADWLRHRHSGEAVYRFIKSLKEFGPDIEIVDQEWPKLD
jgi:hypothetical protein